MHSVETSRRRPRVLVMGGTGTVGGHLLRELAADRERMEVVAAARSEASAARLQALGYPTVTLDLDRHETLVPAMAGVDTLFMLKPYSIDYLIQSKRAIDAAVKAGIGHVVNLGSYGADDTPWASIGWNRLVEAYLRVSGLGHTTLRPNFFMDNVPARADRATGRIIHYFGSTPVSWIAAADIARVAAEVLRRPAEFAGRVLPLATEARTMDEIAAIVSARAGRPYRAEHVPAAAALQQLLARGWQEAFARPFVEYMDAIASGRVPGIGGTAATVEEVTGRNAIGWERYVDLNAARFS